MRRIIGKNLSSFEPLTPLNPDEAVHYVGCNLTNRLVHPESIVERCQEAQILFEEATADAKTGDLVGTGRFVAAPRSLSIPHWLGKGVKGTLRLPSEGREVDAVAVRDTTAAEVAESLERAR